MPTFDFQCKACQAIFEHTRPFGSNQLPKCSKCNSKRTEKLLTPPAIHFKGTGFYKTDAVRKSTAPVKKSEPKKEEVKVDTPKEAPKTSPSPTDKQNSSAQSSGKKV